MKRRLKARRDKLSYVNYRFYLHVSSKISLWSSKAHQSTLKDKLSKINFWRIHCVEVFTSNKDCNSTVSAVGDLQEILVIQTRLEPKFTYEKIEE